jgi:D-3-phosphoglycerate dehydrogenase / 2-oxoglutarate reductase
VTTSEADPTQMKVLVAEKIGDSGVQLLRDAGLEVELGSGWEAAELERRIGEFDGLLIRSATQLDAGLLERAARLKVVGRAGVGVDNVDVEAATKRGVVVANAPQSNVITAAEHTMAMLLALARKVPQAHGSLTGGAWERSKFSGVELYEKTLGVLGFGRIGQLVAQRALGFGMRVVAYDAYVAEERFRDLGVERAASSDDVYAQADFITVHLPVNEETEDWLDSAAFAKMRDGVRVINVARGKLMVEDALREALDSGRVAGAALDVFRQEPVTDHPLFGYPNVVVTPHLGASTAEATDRAGYQAAEQVVAALTGGVVTSAVNTPAIAPEDLDALGPFLPLARDLGRIASTLAERASVDSVEVEYLGRIAERDTRLLTVQVLKGVLAGHVEEEVNDVNAPAISRDRGIAVSETSSTQARDFTDLLRVSVVSGGEGTRVVGTTLGRLHRPHLLEAWGSRFNIQVERHWAVFRYEDRPGMLGRVGTELGNRGINIVSAAVGRRMDATSERPAGASLGSPENGGAVMIVTADSRVPQDVVDIIVSTDGFVAGRTVSLQA